MQCVVKDKDGNWAPLKVDPRHYLCTTCDAPLMTKEEAEKHVC